jgi:hypothetical protein
MAVPASSGQLINQSSQRCCSTLDDGDRGNDKLPAIEGLLTDATPSLSLCNLGIATKEELYN